jgi:catecholate siderophore receptor
MSLKTKPVWMAVMLVLSTSALSVNAEEAEEKTLPEVDVSASKLLPSQDVEGYLARGARTATKTETLLRDVPQSISIVTEEQIEDQAVRSIEDAVRYSPGVGMAQGEGNRDAVVFRGNTTTGDFFVDGIRDDVQYYRDFYNMERVEVLKGPNGMIFGRGGAGGVINRVTKEAGFDPVRELTLQVGSYDQRRVGIDIGQAISESAAFRLNAVVDEGNTYRDGVSFRRHGINPTLTFQPSSQTKVVIGAEYYNDHRTADRGIPFFDSPGRKERPFSTKESTFFGSAHESDTEAEVQNYYALVEHAFGNGLTIRNRTRYSDFDKYYQNVFADSGVAANGNFTVRGYLDYTERQNTFNQTDLLYTAHWGAIEHKLLGGVEMGKQKTDNSRLAAFFNNNFTTTGTQVTLNANNATELSRNTPVTYRANFVNGNNAFRDNSTDIDIFAVYVQDQIVLSKHWEAILGLRYDKFETDFNGIRRNATTNSPIAESFNVDDDFVSPRAGLIFKPIEQVSLYASYSMSYVPRAGDQLTSLTVSNQTFDPEEFKNYEIGAKWDIRPELALNAAVYKLERSNVAINSPSATGQMQLVDGQETKGFELGLIGRITSAWSLTGGYSYQDAEISETQCASAGCAPNAGDILAGAELQNTPRHQFSLWNRYDINDIWGVALGIISRSEMAAAVPTRSREVTLPGYVRLDAAVYAKLDKNLRLQLNVENLLDKEYYLYAHNNNNITPGSPIAGRATLIYDF